VKQLEDGSAILITIAKYLTPNGTDITKKGITPDYAVEITTAEADAALQAQEGLANVEKDPQLNKAVEVLKTLISDTGEMKKIMARRVSAVPVK
jgi:carboxyl-terminal processing protease